MPLYELETFHKTKVSALALNDGPGNAAVIHVGHGVRENSCKIYFYVSHFDRASAFLIPENLTLPQIRIVRDPWRFNILSYKIKKRLLRSGILLSHPWYGEFVSAKPLPPNQYSHLFLKAGGAGDFETFFPIEVPFDSSFDATLRPITDKIDAFVKEMSAGFPTTKLARVEESSAELQSVARLFSLREFEQNATSDAELSAAIPARPSQPVGGSVSSGERELGTEFDYLAHLGRTGDVPSSTQLFSFFRRAARRPTKRFCVVGTARNEGAYILEWIAYHRSLGAEHFFIYTNNNNDMSDNLLHALSKIEYITVINNTVSRSVAPQTKAYGYSLQVLPEITDYEWAAFIDIDEYIGINESVFGIIPEYLSWQERNTVDSIALNWKMYGGNALRSHFNGLTTEGYTYRAAPVYKHVKSMMRPHKFFHSQCHFPIAPQFTKPIYRDESGNVRASGPFAEGRSVEHAWINHYFTRSVEDFFFRRTENRGDQSLNTGSSIDRITDNLAATFLDTFANDGTVSEPMPAERIIKTKAVMTELRSMSGVADAEQLAIRTFRDRVEALREAVRKSAAFSIEGTERYRIAQLFLQEKTGKPVESPHAI